jgi:hypothetical protein
MGRHVSSISLNLFVGTQLTILVFDAGKCEVIQKGRYAHLGMTQVAMFNRSNILAMVPFGKNMHNRDKASLLPNKFGTPCC